MRKNVLSYFVDNENETATNTRDDDVYCVHMNETNIF